MTQAQPVLDLYLASASPRRRELLQQIGMRFEVWPADIDESQHAREAPGDYVSRLALAKARATQARFSQPVAIPTLGADTCVVIDDTILGKPTDREHGLAMLRRLSGREHQVFSAVAVIHDKRHAVRVQLSQVRFRSLTEDECAAYWQTAEPADKAGAYGIQGMGATFVAELHGSHSGVMGLPLFETAELLREFGIDVLQANCSGRL